MTRDDYDPYLDDQDRYGYLHIAAGLLTWCGLVAVPAVIRWAAG